MFEYTNMEELEFPDWLVQVGALLEPLGLTSVDDLPDGPWMDYFEDGLSAEEALGAYQEDGWDDGMLP